MTIQEINQFQEEVENKLIEYIKRNQERLKIAYGERIIAVDPVRESIVDSDTNRFLLGERIWAAHYPDRTIYLGKIDDFVKGSYIPHIGRVTK